MGNPNNLDIWLNASQNTLYSTDAQYLGNYFTLTTPQLSFILDSFTNYSQTLNSILFENFYCYDRKGCTGFDLSITQMASSGITNNTPPVKGIDATVSICQQNVTCAGGFPEISSYYS
jgi:hypothetical protein